MLKLKLVICLICAVYGRKVCPHESLESIDCLENLFSKARGLGYFYNNPTPAEFKNRLRLLILGANADDIPVSSSAPVQQEFPEQVQDGGHFLTNTMFVGLQQIENTTTALEGDLHVRELVAPMDSELESDGSVNFDDETVALLNDMPQQAFRYLAGYVAFKGKKYYANNELGIPSANMSADSNLTVSPPGWIEILSRGGLTVPSL